MPIWPLKKIDPKKLIFTLMVGGYGLLAVGDLPNGRKMNGQYFRDVLLQEARRAAIAITTKTRIEETLMHMDTCEVQKSGKTIRRSQESRIA